MTPANPDHDDVTGDLHVGEGVVIPAGELVETFSRSGGPGGQHVNTSSSRAELRFDVAASSALSAAQKERIRARLASRLTGEGALVVQASQDRSQLRNRRAARRRLAELLRGALAEQRRRRPTRPTATSRRRRVEDKKRRGDVKRLRRRPPPP